MDEDRADVAEAALAHAAAAEAAVMAIVLEMREYLPDFPERVSRRLADDLALRWLAIGSPEAGRNAAAIERLASQELRSVNAEIEFLLREALKKRGVTVKEEKGD